MPIRQVSIERFKGLSAVALSDCRRVNVIIGKNNSGKSSILHALDMAGLALSKGNWGEFEWKMDIKHLFSDAGPFTIAFTNQSGFAGTVRQQQGGDGPTFPTPVPDAEKFRTILIVPSASFGPGTRRHVTPRNVMDQIQARNYNNFNGLDMLYAVKFYASRNERGLQPADYESLVNEVRAFFPDIEGLESERTDQDIATLNYREYGVPRDIVYSGGGLKHLVDILIKIRLSGANVILLDEPENSLHPDLQRRLFSLLSRYARERNVQFFVTTHSPVFLQPSDVVAVFTVRNTKGAREVSRVTEDAVHTAWGDLGLRPSDLLQRDILVLVEGQDDVVFFESVLEKHWLPELDGVQIGIQQYGGGAAQGIVGGKIDVANVAPLNRHVLWVCDRDSKPGDEPAKPIRDLAKALHDAGQQVHILDRREIEYYYPAAGLSAVQGADTARQTRAVEALQGDQGSKLRVQGAAADFQVPGGKVLRRMLDTHLTADHLADIAAGVKGKLVEWRREILGLPAVAPAAGPAGGTVVDAGEPEPVAATPAGAQPAA